MHTKMYKNIEKHVQLEKTLKGNKSLYSNKSIKIITVFFLNFNSYYELVRKLCVKNSAFPGS